MKFPKSFDAPIDVNAGTAGVGSSKFETGDFNNLEQLKNGDGKGGKGKGLPGLLRDIAGKALSWLAAPALAAAKFGKSLLFSPIQTVKSLFGLGATARAASSIAATTSSVVGAEAAAAAAATTTAGRLLSIGTSAATLGISLAVTEVALSALTHDVAQYGARGKAAFDADAGVVSTTAAHTMDFWDKKTTDFSGAIDDTKKAISDGGVWGALRAAGNLTLAAGHGLGAILSPISGLTWSVMGMFESKKDNKVDSPDLQVATSPLQGKSSGVAQSEPMQVQISPSSQGLVFASSE